MGGYGGVIFVGVYVVVYGRYFVYLVVEFLLYFVVVKESIVFRVGFVIMGS